MWVSLMSSQHGTAEQKSSRLRERAAHTRDTQQQQQQQPTSGKPQAVTRVRVAALKLLVTRIFLIF